MSGLQLSDIQNELEQANLEDQTVHVGGGGFDFKKIPMGKHPVRLVEYIEYGEQPQPEYNGEKKDPAQTVRLTFEFLGKRTVTEAVEAEGDNKARPAYAQRKSILLKKSFHAKSTFRKLFEKMREGDTTITNMSQMLMSKAWIMNVIWTTKDEKGDTITLNSKNVEEYEARAEKDKKNKAYRIYDNIRNADGYMIFPAVRDIMDDEGNVTETKAIKVPEPIGAVRMFLWENPSAVLWQSIFIEGTYTKKDGDKEIEVSKNRHQEMCLEASDFEGSALQAMLDGTGEKLGDDAVVDTKEVDDSDEGKSTSTKDVEEKSSTTTDAKTAKSPSEDDEMAELGLDDV